MHREMDVHGVLIQKPDISGSEVRFSNHLKLSNSQNGCSTFHLGPFKYYVSTLRGEGVSDLLIFADKGKGGV